ncbi:MAG: hypothetical protein Pg6B_05320 [Candidatus Azobacteroides pseudotrichonymphae]|jgi:hypothetical protein|nr:MAG: hypothetical protein Pg6B_05320 [Candidatus Azobacteroides pseudotrichonymphae]
MPSITAENKILNNTILIIVPCNSLKFFTGNKLALEFSIRTSLKNNLAWNLSFQFVAS